MSKERLKEAKQIMKDIKKFQKNFNYKQADLAKLCLVEKYGVWLIEQAERVQELEDIIYKDERQAVLESMYDQNKRYREVVGQAISDLENECLWDALVKLKALEGEE